MKKIIDYFLKGLLIFVPIALTVFLIFWAFTNLDSFISGLLKIDTPGVGFLLAVAVTFSVITIIGFLASNFLGKTFFGLIDRLFNALPLVKLLYSSVKDIVGAFAGDKKSFDKPVLASITPGSGVKVVGFITRQSLENFGLEDYVAVYTPQSYNFAGNVLLFPKESIQPLDIESSKAMTFIVSGGVSGG